jgi:hypothetical protein
VALFFAAGGMALFFHALETRRICNLYWIAQFGDAASCAQPQYFFADETCGIRSVVALECHHGITGCGPGSMEYQACRAIVEAKYRTHAEADQMTDSDCRNTLITEISVAGGGAIKYLQTKGDADLIKMLPQQLSRPRQPGGIGYMPDLLAQEVLLPLLRCIDVSGNRQLTATPQWWGNIPNLSHLDLSDSGVENLPLSLCSGNAANTITTIDVKFTPASLNVDWHHNLGGSVPRLTSLSNMSLACRDAVRDTVVRLNISHNRFLTIQAMVDLDEFSQLTSVDLRWNNITHFDVQWAEQPLMLLPTTDVSSSQKPEILFEKIQEWYAKDVVSNFKTMDGLEDEDEGVDATELEVPKLKKLDLPFSSIFQHAVDLSTSPSSVLKGGGMEKHREKGKVVGGGRGGGDPSMKTFQKIPCPVLGMNGGDDGNPMTTFSFLNIPCTYIMQCLHVVTTVQYSGAPRHNLSTETHMKNTCSQTCSLTCSICSLVFTCRLFLHTPYSLHKFPNTSTSTVFPNQAWSPSTSSACLSLVECRCWTSSDTSLNYVHSPWTIT